ncbi:unnamed protein product [Cyprideis torosa]|nr:unnamed protein product [Cyprideis torosa]CAG0909046.1 unnamed protein product [Cyprideis torosa]
MPGQVKAVNCSVGDTVGENQEVCVIEAMKMQNALATPMAGTVSHVHVKVGDTVEEDQVLVEIQPAK